jgi:hypothetical protein
VVSIEDAKKVNEAHYWDYKDDFGLPRITINRADEVMVSPTKSDQWYIVDAGSLLLLIEGAIQGGFSDITVAHSVMDEKYHTVRVEKGNKL